MPEVSLFPHTVSYLADNQPVQIQNIQNIHPDTHIISALVLLLLFVTKKHTR